MLLANYPPPLVRGGGWGRSRCRVCCNNTTSYLSTAICRPVLASTIEGRSSENQQSVRWNAEEKTSTTTALRMAEIKSVSVTGFANSGRKKNCKYLEVIKFRRRMKSVSGWPRGGPGWCLGGWTDLREVGHYRKYLFVGTNKKYEDVTKCFFFI